MSLPVDQLGPLCCWAAAGLLCVGATTVRAGIAGTPSAGPANCTRYVDDYGAVGDGVTDDTRAIQAAVDHGFNGVWDNVARVVFAPGKTYRISHQIVLWSGIHLDTDPLSPATILLAARTPGFGDPLHVKHMFLSRLSAGRPDCQANPVPFPLNPNEFYGRPGAPPYPGWPWQWPEDYDSAKSDETKVHPGYGEGNNFWSQIRNLHFRVEPGNPGAGVMHYKTAQGSYLGNLDFDLGDARYAVAGGPVIVNCTFRGGRWGLYDPPNMQFGLVMSSRFEGQHEAAYYQGATSSRMWLGTTFEDTPLALKIAYPRSLIMVNCEIRRAALGVSLDGGNTQVMIQNLKGFQVPVLYHSPRKVLPGRSDGTVTLPTFVQGDVVNEGQWVDGGGIFPTTTELPTWMSALPDIDLARAANVRDFGAAGDGVADDTAAFRRAVAASDVVYMPAGAYRLSDTVMLRRNTKLVGEHVQAVRIVFAASTPGFADPKNMRPILDTPDDPQGAVHLSQFTMLAQPWGVGGNVGAIGLRWRVGRRSSVVNCNFHAAATPILITGNGGGTFFSIWMGHEGVRGFVVDHNREPLVVYALSSEHQTDKSVQLIGARDVAFYMSSGGEGDYATEKVVNEFVDCDRIAWISLLTHPAGADSQRGPDIDVDKMTCLRIRNSTNVWVGPLMRTHEEKVLHTLLDIRPDGKVVDLGNRGFTLYRRGEINARAGQVAREDPLAWSAVAPASWLVRRGSAGALKAVLDGSQRPSAAGEDAAWTVCSVQDGRLAIPAARGGLVWAQVWFFNPESQPVVFDCESVAALRCWLDGEELKSEGTQDRWRCARETARGWRRLLVQLDDQGKGTALQTTIKTPAGRPTGGVFHTLPPPVSAPMALVVKAAGSTVQLAWQRPGDWGADRVRVVRNEQHYPAGPTDGQIVYEGAENVFADDTKRERGALFYGFYTLDRSGAVSSGLVQRVDLGEAPFLADWLACGPFDAPSMTNNGYNTAYIDEVAAAPRPGEVAGGKAWDPVSGAEIKGDAVDLLARYKKGGNLAHHQVAYLHAYVHAATRVECSLLIGSDDGFRVWLNGKQAGGEDRNGMAIADNYAIPVVLEQGWNRLLVKVTQGTGDWKLIARLAQADGSRVSTALTTACTPQRP